MRITTMFVLICMLAVCSSAWAQEPMEWHRVAVTIPLGSKVKIHRMDGGRISGTLMSVDDTSVAVKRNSRRPEPAVTIPFDQVAILERDHGGGFSVGKAIAVGLGAGAGAMLTLFVIFLQID